MTNEKSQKENEIPNARPIILDTETIYTTVRVLKGLATWHEWFSNDGSLYGFVGMKDPLNGIAISNTFYLRGVR